MKKRKMTFEELKKHVERYRAYEKAYIEAHEVKRPRKWWDDVHTSSHLL